jgi:putative flippase GtrA
MPNRARRLLKFNLATGAFSIAANLLFTKLLVDSGFNYLSANVMAIALCSIINFFINDRLVFVVTCSSPSFAGEVTVPKNRAGHLMPQSRGQNPITRV